MYLWYKQPGLNSRTPKNLKELVVFGHKMKKPTKCRTGVLSQSGASIFAARPIRVSNFALGERKIKKNCPLLQQISIQKNFALCITLLLVFVMGSLLHMHQKYI